MADLGPLIVVGATAVSSFGLGLAADTVRHRLQRKARFQDERISIYGSYLSATMQEATIFSGLLTGTERLEDLLALSRQHEQLVGPVRLYANNEVRELLTELADAYERFTSEASRLASAGRSPANAVIQAWGNEMRPIVDRLEDAMRRHTGLKP